jgi:hypothetical protein
VKRSRKVGLKRGAAHSRGRERRGVGWDGILESYGRHAPGSPSHSTLSPEMDSIDGSSLPLTCEKRGFQDNGTV